METPMEPLTGEESTGADGTVTVVSVVKLQTLDQLLVPAELVAFTRQ